MKRSAQVEGRPAAGRRAGSAGETGGAVGIAGDRDAGAAGRARLFWGAVGLALAVRAAHVLTLPAVPVFLRPTMDAAMHETWARGILAGTWPGAEPFFRAPLYPYFLAGLIGLFENLLGLTGAPLRVALALAHAVVSALGGGCVALAAARLWGRRAGWLSALVYAGLWTSIYFVGELLLETLATTLLLVLAWLLLDRAPGADAPPSGRRLFLLGLVAGLGAITRPPLLVVLPVAAWFLWRHAGLRARSHGWLLLLAGLALPILPVAARNLVRGGDAVLIATQGGVNFYIGNNPQSDGRTAIVPGTRATWQGGYEDAIAQAERAAGRALKPSEVDRHYLREGLRFLATQPGRALRLYAEKTRLLFGAGERSNNNNPYFWRRWSIVLKWPVWLGWAPVLALAVLGLARRDLARGARWLLLGSAGAYALSLLAFFINGRFRLPLLGLLAIPAGAGAERLWLAIRQRRWPDARWAPFVAAALLLLSLSDLLTFRENRVEADAFSRFTLGNAYYDLGRRDEARRAYEDALAVQRRFKLSAFALIEEPLYTSLGRLLREANDTAGALRLYTEWVRGNPQTLAGRLALGDLLLQTGRTDEAAAQFEMVLRAEPENPAAQLGFAWILRANGDLGAALRRFRTLAEQRRDPQALFGAGLCLIDLERYGEAETAFLEVLRLQPDYWQALGNLAGLYDRQGRLAEARRTYERLLAVRPDDPFARQWLAGHPR